MMEMYMFVVTLLIETVHLFNSLLMLVNIKNIHYNRK
jgi:hypothetical protein